ncbi:MAG TPA: hypothetical protein VHC49_10885 [Mycobacteriales bacterium]|nr:hypothetical protein [Mycobacteriales bacterium]
MTDIVVDCATPTGPITPIWASFGYDELNWTGTPRGLRNLGRMRQVLGDRAVVRAHNIFTSGNGRAVPHWSSGNVYHEDADGNPYYDWDLVDRAFDAWVGANLRPIIELGFCPAALTRDLPGPEFVPMPSLYGRYEASLWASPPKDFSRWGGLVAATARHFVERYGAQEVSSWYWELWNEPDISYWQGTAAEYCELYDVTVAAVREVLPDGLVGGPATTGGGAEFLREFLEHCISGRNSVTGEIGTPIDFVSFHTKGAPGFPRLYTPTGSHGATGGEKQSPSTQKMLDEIVTSLDIVRSHAQLAEVPVLVDECDPGVPAHYGVYDNPNYQFRNTSYYPVFQIQLMKRLLDLDRPDRRGITRATAWTWYLEGDRFFEGTRSFFTAADVAAPVLSGYELLGRLGPTRLAAGDGVLATSHPDGRITVLAWNHEDDQYDRSTATVSLRLQDLPCAGRRVRITHHRIDAEHTNTHTRWVAEGSPQDPSDEQVRRIRAAEALEYAEPERIEAACPGELTFRFELAAPAVSLIEIVPE